MTFGGVPVGAAGNPGAALLIDAIAQDRAGGGVRNDLLSERPLVPQLLDKSMAPRAGLRRCDLWRTRLLASNQ